MARFFIVTDPTALETVLVPTDPRHLDRYARHQERRRVMTPEMKKNLERLKRALQMLPPRELDMLFATKVNDGIQNKVRGRFSVQQSNISYHMERAQERIDLYTKINSYFSETRLRQLLYRVGAEPQHVQIVLGFVKTENQSITAKIVGNVTGTTITQGVARSIFFAVRDLVVASSAIESRDKVKILELMEVVSQNFNRLRAPASQVRWETKVSGGNYTSAERLLAVTA